MVTKYIYHSNTMLIHRFQNAMHRTVLCELKFTFINAYIQIHRTIYYQQKKKMLSPHSMRHIQL